MNKNLIPNISQASRSNQLLEENKLEIEIRELKPSVNNKIIMRQFKILFKKHNVIQNVL